MFVYVLMSSIVFQTAFYDILKMISYISFVNFHKPRKQPEKYHYLTIASVNHSYKYLLYSYWRLKST